MAPDLEKKRQELRRTSSVTLDSSHEHFQMLLQLRCTGNALIEPYRHGKLDSPAATGSLINIQLFDQLYALDNRYFKPGTSRYFEYFSCLFSLRHIFPDLFICRMVDPIFLLAYESPISNVSYLKSSLSYYSSDCIDLIITSTGFVRETRGNERYAKSWDYLKWYSLTFSSCFYTFLSDSFSSGLRFVCYVIKPGKFNWDMFSESCERSGNFIAPAYRWILLYLHLTTLPNDCIP